ncbi:hypothetical protein FB45DRAFT_1064697 [Roridomyces roridus]|uniref:F-box domain-containing protein n=1 Tax=Roridomyces roridus TaxID=1738132 RepID=A0AAD7BA60_9AGAR|nr:hypothetical protein FB45DRAFT_1064697 [Roridomyces roridus]
MHRALLIPEIAVEICEILPQDDEIEDHSLDAATSSALAALAGTCRMLQNPALDVLWRFQTSVINVLNCMLGGVWEWPEDGLGEVSLRRPVLPQDWERPLFYSRRVKYLGTGSDSHLDMLTSGFYDMLSLCLPNEPLFPNLESIEEWDPDTYPITYFRPFFGPLLTTLCIGVCQSAAQLSFLGSIGTLCPQIKTLHVRYSPDLAGRLEILSVLVRQLKHLRDLTVPCLDGEALDHASSLPSLRTLKLTDQPSNPMGRHTAEHGECRALITRMDLTCNDTSAAAGVLSRFEASSLQWSSFVFPGDTIANDIARVCRSITEVQPYSLVSLIIASGAHNRVHGVADPAQLELYSISSTSLHPLFELKNLTLVRLSGPVGFDLDDGSVTDIARGWPQIEVLELKSSTFKHVTPRATLRCLISFARFCPYLHRLWLTLDATTVPSWEEIHGQRAEESRIQQSHLIILTVPESPVGPPLAVAAFLSSVFPTLELVYSDDGMHPLRQGDSGLRDQWKAVTRALPVLRSERS